MFLVAGMSLTACSKKSERDILVPESTVASSGRVEDQFGKGFGEAFRADPNSVPANVSDADVQPVSLTAQPVAID